MPITGQITQLTNNVEVYLTPTGSGPVYVFDIDIYKWDTGSNAEVLSGSYATGVTPDTLSAYNNHSLMDGYPDGGSGFGYGISGITFDCTKVRLTTNGTTGQCNGGTADYDLTHAASKIYNPSTGTWTTTYSGTGIAYAMIFSGGASTGANLTYPGDYPFKFVTLPWGQAQPYYDYGPSGFTVTHRSSKKVSDNSNLTGGWANGPLVNLTVEYDAGVPDGKHFAISAQQRSGVTTTYPGDYIVSIYRVTWDDSGNFMDVNFYWETDTYQQ